MAILRSLLVVLPLGGLVGAACSGSSTVNDPAGAGGTGGGSATGGTGGKSGAAATGGSSGRGGGTGGKGAGGSGSAGKGSGGTGGSGGSEQAGEGGVPSSGGSSGTGMGGMAGIPLGQAPMRLADAVCAKAFECCNAQELSALLVTTEDQCRLLVATYVTTYQVNIEASIAAMRATYDGVALADCVDAHEARTCDDLPSFAEIGCAGAVVPLVAMGETCGAHHECIDGYCDGAGPSASTPTGTCAPKKADGEPCAQPFECEGGACSTADGCGPTSDMPICGG